MLAYTHHITPHRTVFLNILCEHRLFPKLAERLTVEMPYGDVINICLLHVLVPGVDLFEQQPAVLGSARDCLDTTQPPKSTRVADIMTQLGHVFHHDFHQ